MDRIGRRRGMSLGYVLGIAGTSTAAFAVILQSLPLFLAGIFGLGMTKGILDQGRYAAAEASHPARRAQAISWVVLGGTAGSILGPTLISVSSSAAQRAGLPGLTGPWLAGSVLFVLALGLINLFLRPEPQEIARQFATADNNPEPVVDTPVRSYQEIIRLPEVQIAVTTLIAGQLAMVVVMTMTPVHMHQHQHGLGAISWVIMAHTLGMFGLSTVTGWLVEKYGRTTIIMAGSMVLASACLTAPLYTSVTWLTISLFLLGLGWNFCFVAGSALLSDRLFVSERGRVQGLTDTWINSISGVGSIGGGLIFAATGYAIISWLSIIISLTPLTVILIVNSIRKTAELEQPA
jgi:MFS family permease